MKKQEKRPKIKLKLSLYDKALEIFAGVLLLLMLSKIISVYGSLPDIIPIHYNLKGEVDGYGNKATLFVLVFICFFNYTLLTIINFSPHTFTSIRNFLANRGRVICSVYTISSYV